MGLGLGPRARARVNVRVGARVGARADLGHGDVRLTLGVWVVLRRLGELLGDDVLLDTELVPVWG